MFVLLVAIAIMALLEIIVSAHLHTRFNPHFTGPTVQFFIANTLSEVFFILSWTALYVTFSENVASAKQRERLAQAETAARDAQIAMLRFQINPHFLFNTLNAISTLVLDNRNAAAERMLSRLSRFMRHALDQSSAQMVTLAEEVAAQRLYLEIEQERFGARLVSAFEIDQDCEDELVPGLILQPLVENAVKHAVAPSPSGGSITVAARQRDGALELTVCDDGPGVSTQAGAGVGLRNTAARLAALYGERAQFKAGPGPGGGFCAAIRLPRD